MSVGCSSIRGNCSCCWGSTGGTVGEVGRECKGEGGRRNKTTAFVAAI